MFFFKKKERKKVQKGQVPTRANDTQYAEMTSTNKGNRHTTRSKDKANQHIHQQVHGGRHPQTNIHTTLQPTHLSHNRARPRPKAVLSHIWAFTTTTPKRHTTIVYGPLLKSTLNPLLFCDKNPFWPTILCVAENQTDKHRKYHCANQTPPPKISGDKIKTKAVGNKYIFEHRNKVHSMAYFFLLLQP